MEFTRLYGAVQLKRATAAAGQGGYQLLLWAELLCSETEPFKFQNGHKEAPWSSTENDDYMKTMFLTLLTHLYGVIQI